LIKLHDDYTLIQNGLGDSFISYLPEAVRQIGLWDERFIFSYHVEDYLLRAVLYNRKNSCINDKGHNRILNPVFDDKINKSANYLVNADPREIDEAWEQSSYSYHIGQKLLELKYSGLKFDEIKNESSFVPKINNHVYYPYFEKDIHDLEGKNYLWDDSFQKDIHENGLLSRQYELMSDQTKLISMALSRTPLPRFLKCIGLYDNIKKWESKFLK